MFNPMLTEAATERIKISFDCAKLFIKTEIIVSWNSISM